MEKTTKLDKTSFSGISFDNIVEDLVGLIKNNPKYNKYWEDYTSNDYTRLLIELFAWITDQLATRIDFAVNENFLTTAQQKSSIIKLLKLIGYDLRRPNSAVVNVKCFAKNQFPVGVDEISLTEQFIPDETKESTVVYKNPFSIVTTGTTGINKTFELIPYEYDNNQKRYRFKYGQKVSVPSSTYTSYKTLQFYEGVTIKETYSVDTSSGAKVIIGATSIIENSIEAYLQIRSGTGEEYTYYEEELYQVKSFTSPEAQDPSGGIPYVINTLENNGAEIEFGNEVLLPKSTKRPPANAIIAVYYRVGGGEGGNIVSGGINSQTEVQDTIFSFINEEAGFGGTNEESIEEAVSYAPKTLKTVNKTVTEEDYDIILSQDTNVLLSRSYGANSGVSETELLNRYKTLIKPFEVWNFIVPNRNEIIEKNTNEYGFFEFFTKSKHEYINYPAVYRNGALNQSQMASTPTTFIEDVTFFEQTTNTGNKASFYNYFIVSPPESFKSKVLDENNEYVNPAFKLKIRDATTLENRVSTIDNYVRTGDEDYSLNFDFDFDFVGNGNLVNTFSDATGLSTFRKIHNVKAMFKSLFNNDAFNLSTNNRIKFSINNRGFVEVQLPNDPATTRTEIITAINDHLNDSIGILGSVDTNLCTGSYRRHCGYYNYPSEDANYSGLTSTPIKFSEIKFAETSLTETTQTIYDGNSDGFGNFQGDVNYFFYEKNGVQYSVPVQFGESDLVRNSVSYTGVPVGNILDLFNNDKRVVDTTYFPASPFAGLNLRAFLVEGRLRVFSIDGEEINILDEGDILGVTYPNFLATMIDEDTYVIVDSNETVSYEGLAQISSNYILLKSTKSGSSSSIEFKEASVDDGFQTIFGRAFTEATPSWLSYGTIGATLIVNPGANFGNIYIENMSPYIRTSNIWLNYVLDDSWEFDVPGITEIEGSYFDKLGNFDSSKSNINIKITRSKSTDVIFDNIQGLDFDYTLKREIIGKNLTSSIDVTNKILTVYISLKDYSIAKYDIEFTPGSMWAADIVNFVNNSIQNKLTTLGFSGTYSPFVLDEVDEATDRIIVQNYDNESHSFIYFYGFTNLANPVADSNNLFPTLFNYSDFQPVYVDETYVVLAVFNQGDYYITYGAINSDNKRTISIVKNHSNDLDISRAPDGDFYFHFIDDKTNGTVLTDEEYFNDYLDRYKITCVQNRFISPKIIPIDIAGKVTIEKKAVRETVKKKIEEVIKQKLRLGNLNFGEPMITSYVESLIYSVPGVKWANLSYIGRDYTIPTTNKAYSEDGGEIASFDEVLVIADNKLNENDILIHGIILEYSNVY